MKAKFVSSEAAIASGGATRIWGAQASHFGERSIEFARRDACFSIQASVYLKIPRGYFVPKSFFLQNRSAKKRDSKILGEFPENKILNFARTSKYLNNSNTTLAE